MKRSVISSVFNSLQTRVPKEFTYNVIGLLKMCRPNKRAVIWLNMATSVSQLTFYFKFAISYVITCHEFWRMLMWFSFWKENSSNNRLLRYGIWLLYPKLGLILRADSLPSIKPWGFLELILFRWKTISPHPLSRCTLLFTTLLPPPLLFGPLHRFLCHRFLLLPFFVFPLVLVRLLLKIKLRPPKQARQKSVSGLGKTLWLRN